MYVLFLAFSNIYVSNNENDLYTISITDYGNILWYNINKIIIILFVNSIPTAIKCEIFIVEEKKTGKQNSCTCTQYRLHPRSNFCFSSTPT